MPATGQQQVIHLPDNPNFNYFLHFKKLIAGLLWVFEEKDGRNGLLLMVQQWLDLEARFPSLLWVHLIVILIIVFSISKI